MGWHQPGGIQRLGGVLKDYRAELVFDLRALCGVGLYDLRLRELVDLVEMLLADTRSWVFARYAGWDYPVSREFLASAATRDAVVLVNTPRKNRAQFKAYPTPFPTGKRYGGRGKSKRRSIDEVRALLRPE